MAIQASFDKRVFHFSFDARTSRGLMKERVSWFVKVADSVNPELFGVGECAPLAGLSPELEGDVESLLQQAVNEFNTAAVSDAPTDLRELHTFIRKHAPSAAASSLLFALETALLDLSNGGIRKLFDAPLLKGKTIPINGLIWMGGLDNMLQQIEIKIRDGYRCIKLKVGGLDFEKECDVLQYIRRKYFRDNIVIRLDANGAIKPDDAYYKLKEMSKYTIHSIEQPFKPGSDKLPELCANTPIPIALDEELIRVPVADRAALLDRIKPQYIILKPSLHGGLAGCKEWIALAEERKIGWWITSALESNVGLNAIAQFTSLYPVEIPQGLGTGMIYTDNINSPLEVSNNGVLSYNHKLEWEGL